MEILNKIDTHWKKRRGRINKIFKEKVFSQLNVKENSILTRKCFLCLITKDSNKYISIAIKFKWPKVIRSNEEDTENRKKLEEDTENRKKSFIDRINRVINMQ